MLNKGYSAVYIKKSLGISYKTIRRYKDGDPDLLCRDTHPERQSWACHLIDKHKDFIIECLNNKMTVAAILQEINKYDPAIKKSTFFEYCARLKAEYGINKTNTVGKELIAAPIRSRYIKRRDIFQYLWTEEKLSAADYAIAYEKYDAIKYLENFIYDFKSVFSKKEKVLLTGFIEIYAESPYGKIRSLAKGLLTDIDAIEHAVESPYSNGFVEGNNNRIKMIKRMMYGRAKLPLLRLKILHGQ